jgi:hypothetical protein
MPDLMNVARYAPGELQPFLYEQLQALQRISSRTDKTA